MVGRIARMFVQEGDTVQEGDSVVLISAMKMVSHVQIANTTLLTKSATEYGAGDQSKRPIGWTYFASCGAAG